VTVLRVHYEDGSDEFELPYAASVLLRFPSTGQGTRQWQELYLSDLERPALGVELEHDPAPAAPEPPPMKDLPITWADQIGRPAAEAGHAMGGPHPDEVLVTLRVRDPDAAAPEPEPKRRLRRKART
jgi:hypothetical protein